MSDRRRWLGGAGAVLVAALLVPYVPAAAARTKTGRADAVLIRIDSVSPSTPRPSNTLKPLEITLTLTNTTSVPYDDVQIIGERGAPIGTQAALDDALDDPTPPAVPDVEIAPSEPATADLPANESVQVVFRTTTGIPTTAGLCLCASGQIYPLFFSAHATLDGVDQQLGVAATYVPAFYEKPQPVRVSWVWPLLDAPHRIFDDTVFTDDDLATSLSSGRLSRALEVVEQVGGRVPLTLLVDPELLDEIDVMATEQYTVQQPDGTTSAGTGQAAAATWLDRLDAVLLDDPEVTVRLTPYADPDVETLTQRALKWATALPAAMSERVTEVLAGRAPDTSLAWPVTGALSRQTLHRLSEQDVRTLLLSSTGVTLSSPAGSVPPGLVNLKPDRSATGPQVAAALLTPAIEKYVARAVSAGGDGSAVLPELVSELAIRAVQQPDVEHALTLAPPRYVDPDVAAAVRTIDETTSSTFAKPIALADAVADSTLPSPQFGRLAKVPGTVSADLPPTYTALGAVIQNVRTVRSLLDTRDDPAAAALVDSLPLAIQRAESSAWRGESRTESASAFADQLGAKIEGIVTGVHIVKPSSGTYTLASDTALLPITVANDLPYTVRVLVKIVTVQTSGFSTDPVDVQSVEAKSTRTVKVPATSVRPGLIKIDVLLQAPCRNCPLGEAIRMSVRSTALGFIGVIITVVAGVVLGIALLWRIFRRVRSRGAAGPPPAERLPVPTPEPAA